MKRIGCLVVLLALGSSAHASELSFVIGGHRIQIDAAKSCRSASCVSVSIPGVYASRRARDRDAGVATSPQPAPAKPPVAVPAAAPAASPPAQAPAIPAPVVAPIGKPALQTAATSPAPPPPAPSAPQPPIALAASAAQQVPPPSPKVEPVETSPVEKAADTPPVIAHPVPEVAAAPVTVAQDIDSEPADTPLGDWQTDGKTGLVRIERCGGALCGYMLDAATMARGETVLINMKPKHVAQWSGSIYSRASGNTYYATMAMKQPDRLRVEACVIGEFLCSGNDWTRVAGGLRELITSRRVTPLPRS